MGFRRHDKSEYGKTTLRRLLHIACKCSLHEEILIL